MATFELTSAPILTLSMPKQLTTSAEVQAVLSLIRA